MTYSEIRSAISTLNLPLEDNLLKAIVDDIALNKQFTQTDLREIKKYCTNVSALYKVLHDIQRQTPDLIIVPDEDAFSFD